MDDDRLLWKYVILGVLRDGKVHHLREIYDACKELGGRYINPQLFKFDGTKGERPDYTHVVRGMMHILWKEQGLVEHVGKGRTGIYRITDSGKKELDRMEQNDEIYSNR